MSEQASSWSFRVVPFGPIYFSVVNFQSKWRDFSQNELTNFGGVKILKSPKGNGSWCWFRLVPNEGSRCGSCAEPAGRGACVQHVPKHGGAQSGSTQPEVDPGTSADQERGIRTTGCFTSTTSEKLDLEPLFQLGKTSQRQTVLKMAWTILNLLELLLTKLTPRICRTPGSTFA